MRCRRLRATNTDPRRPRGGLRTANRRIPLAWLPSDAPAPQGREAAKTFMGRGDGVLLGRRTLEDDNARRYWTTALAGSLARPRPRLIAHREPPKYRFHPQVLAVSVSLDHERTERSSNRFFGTLRAGLSKCVSSTIFGYVADDYNLPVPPQADPAPRPDGEDVTLDSDL